MRWVALLTICLLCATAQAQDWGVKRDPFDPVVIRQYKTLLARDPHDAALRQLVALYKGYRTVAKLEEEYRAQLDASPADWATLVVLARLTRSDRAATIALWNRALQANSKDARGWLALGEVTVDAKSARVAFQKAVEHAASKTDKRAALIKLIGAARSAGDPQTVDASYVALIELSPKDGQLWLDRGNAQLAAGKVEPAIESFVKAEELLTTDPERRLTAMMNRGVALERLGRVDDAITQWVQTLDKSPRDSYLRREIVPRIVDAERKRGRLTNAITFLEKRWPEATRAFYEWDMLADLYVEARDDEKALLAYRRAIAKAPTEIGTQRKLIRMLDKLRPTEALKQHEAAARLAPGDSNLQLELAKRYHDTEHDPAKAYETLDRLAIRLAKDVGARLAMAELYAQWEDRTRTLVEREAVANLEPNEPDHAVVLGDAYWRAGYKQKAVAAWQRLTKIKTAATQLRLGEILALHSQWAEAASAFTTSLELDGTNADAWRGRARAYDELRRHSEAIADARRAVALIGIANSDDGARARLTLVRALGRVHPGQSQIMVTELARWRFAFERGDIAAGYLLVAHHSRIQSHQHHDALVELYRRVPTDDALGIAVARSFSKKKNFVRARQELQKIAQRTPKRAPDIAHLIDQVDADRKHAAEEVYRLEHGRKEPPKDILGRRRSRIGLRFGVGADVHGTSSASAGFGFYRTRGFGTGTGTAITTRFDWSQRDDELDEVNALAIAAGVTKRLLSTRRVELAIGGGPRFELRYGSDAMQSSWGRAGVAADVTFEILPKTLPATVGLRFQQALTDPVRGSGLFVELGFEVR